MEEGIGRRQENGVVVHPTFFDYLLSSYQPFGFEKYDIIS